MITTHFYQILTEKIEKEKAVELLLAYLEKETDKDMKIIIISAFAKIGSEKAVDPLIKQLKDKNNSEEVRKAIINSLSQIASGNKLVLEELKNILKLTSKTQITDIETRRYILNAISNLLSPKEFFYFESLVSLTIKEEIQATSELYDNNIFPTPYLIAEYRTSENKKATIDEWKSTLSQFKAKTLKLNRENKLHRELGYTNYRADIDCCFSSTKVKGFTYEAYLQLFVQKDVLGPVELAGEQEAELVYAGYEAYKVYDYLVRLSKKAKQLKIFRIKLPKINLVWA